MRWIIVSAVFQERDPLTVGDQPVRQRMGVEQHVVAGTFAIEGKAGAIMADPDNSARSFMPGQRRGTGRSIPTPSRRPYA